MNKRERDVHVLIYMCVCVVAVGVCMCVCTADLKSVRRKKRKLKTGPDATEAEEFTCLVRASCSGTKSTKEATATTTTTTGGGAPRSDEKDESAAKGTGKGGRVKRKKVSAPTKISTLITPREVTRFTNSLTALQKAAMVDELHGGGMKKKDKSAKKKK